jgi:hypothetical protein
MKIKPRKKLIVSMLFRLVIVIAMFVLAYDVWMSPSFKCIDFYVTDFCGRDEKEMLVLGVFTLTAFLPVYLLHPFFKFISLRTIIKNRNRKNK